MQLFTFYDELRNFSNRFMLFENLWHSRVPHKEISMTGCSRILSHAPGTWETRFPKQGFLLCDVAYYKKNGVYSFSNGAFVCRSRSITHYVMREWKKKFIFRALKTIFSEVARSLSDSIFLLMDCFLFADFYLTSALFNADIANYRRYLWLRNWPTAHSLVCDLSFSVRFAIECLFFQMSCFIIINNFWICAT